MCKRNSQDVKKKKAKKHGTCKRNSPDKNEASTGCVRETPQMFKTKQKKQKQHVMCKRNSSKENKSSQHGTRKGNTPQKNKARMGYVRETLDLKMKLPLDL